MKGPKYSEENFIGFNKIYKSKYQPKKMKLFSNDIKAAFIIAPTTLIMGLATNQIETASTCLYIMSGCSIVYAGVNLYSNKKQKQKKFTLK